MTKRNHSVGYFSAYYRGLEVLLDMWPAIRKFVPDATLDIAYGWNSWVGIEGKNDFFNKMEAKFLEMEDQGVTVHGRLSHVALAKLMKDTQVWAYPTEFAEINCITALKAQEAGMYPVVTQVGALNEVVINGMKIAAHDIYTNKKAQAEFIAAVVNAFKYIDEHEAFNLVRVPNIDWSDIAKEWEKVF